MMHEVGPRGEIKALGMTWKMAVALLAIVFACLILPSNSSLAAVTCEELPQDLCAFAISASSKRCLLESIPRSHNGPLEYQCQTSGVVVEGMSNLIETDACMSACGLDRTSVGISSDALMMEPEFASKLCSVPCYHNCPNIINLYINLAAGEGVCLSELCETRRVNSHRAMLEFLGSDVAPSPVAGSDAGKTESRFTVAFPVASPPASA